MAGARARTAWTRSTSSSPTRGTTPSRMSNRTSRYASIATSCAREGCAAGRWRGGIGPIRETELLDDAGFSIEGEGQRFPPWGHAGGGEGRPSRITLVRADGSEQALPSKLAHMKAAAGDRVIVTSRLRWRLRRSAAAPARAGIGGRYRRPYQRRGGAARLRRGRHRSACARRRRHSGRTRGAGGAGRVRVFGLLRRRGRARASRVNRAAYPFPVSAVLFVSVTMLRPSCRR